MLKIIYIYVFIALLGVTVPGFSQFYNENIPIINYSKYDLQLGQQTWQIDASDVHYTYFANNSGLIVHDGKNWEKLPVPNNTIVRSVKKHKNKIYVGTQGEFGFYELENNQYKYTSLSKILKFRNYNDIWHIEVGPRDEVFFRSDESIFFYDGLQVTRLMVGSGKYNYLGKLRNQVVIQDQDGFLFMYEQGAFRKPETLMAKFDKGRIAAILPYANDTVLVATVYDGIFYLDKDGFSPWKTNIDDVLKKSNIYCAQYSDVYGLGLGTSYNGVIVIDKERKLSNKINKNKGLQNNSVLSIAFTRSGDIWAGLDNGLSFIHLNANIHNITPDGDAEGTGYTVQFFKNKYYFGTNTGVYVKDNQTSQTTLLPGTGGQVWQIQEWKNHLIINHHNGLFAYDGKKMSKLSSRNGWWKILPLTDSLALAGNYEGLFYLHYNQGEFTLDEKKSEFIESCRILEMDKNKNIWVAHPYRGIYLLKYEDWKNKKTRVAPLPEVSPDGTGFYFNVFPHPSGILIQSKKSFYVTNDGLSFIRDTFLEKFIDPQIELRLLKQDIEKTIWFITKTETGFLYPHKHNVYQKKLLNEIHGRLPEGFQTVVNVGNNMAVFPLDKGFVFLNQKDYLKSGLKVDGFVSKVKYSIPGKDSILYFTHSDSTIEYNLPYFFTNLHLYLSGNNSSQSDFVMYSYQINDDTWSAWNRDHIIRIYTLHSGNHKIKVRMMNESGNSRQIASLQLKISFPWYRNPIAIGFYFLISIFLIYQYFRYLQENHRKEVLVIEAERALQEQRHLAEKEHTQNEIIQLQNEKLTNELNFKNQELASFTYHLVSKNELIQGIDHEISKLEKKYPDHQNLLKDLRNIHKLAEQNINADADWEKFISNFDLVHAEFFKRLTDDYPDLSPSDYKLCTYLRMNLTSKEIASIMNISLRSVETNRYRLRKKMHLDTDTNLVQFLINF